MNAIALMPVVDAACSQQLTAGAVHPVDGACCSLAIYTLGWFQFKSGGGNQHTDPEHEGYRLDTFLHAVSPFTYLQTPRHLQS